MDVEREKRAPPLWSGSTPALTSTLLPSLSTLTASFCFLFQDDYPSFSTSQDVTLVGFPSGCSSESEDAL